MSDVHEQRMSGEAAKRKLDELDDHHEQQKTLPDLRVRKAEIEAEKQRVAAEIAKFGEAGRYQMSVAEYVRQYGPERNSPDYEVPKDYDETIERLSRRDALFGQLRELNLALNAVNAEIAAIPPPVAATDLAAHKEDLRRRAGL